jgi:hypothetical protein
MLSDTSSRQPFKKQQFRALLKGITIMPLIMTGNSPGEGRIPFPPSQSKIGLPWTWALLNNALFWLEESIGYSGR